MHVSRDGYLNLLFNDVHNLLSDLLYNQSDGFTFEFRKTATSAKIEAICGRVALSLILYKACATSNGIEKFINKMSRDIHVTLLTSRRTCLPFASMKLVLSLVRPTQATIYIPYHFVRV